MSNGPSSDGVIARLIVNGVAYVPESVGGEQQAAAGSDSEDSDSRRAVVVVDRGWVFAGDVEEADGRIRLRRAIWVFEWRNIGFDGMLANPMHVDVTLRRMPYDVDIPAAAEIYRVPVPADWGLAACR